MLTWALDVGNALPCQAFLEIRPTTEEEPFATATMQRLLHLINNASYLGNLGTSSCICFTQDRYLKRSAA